MTRKMLAMMIILLTICNGMIVYEHFKKKTDPSQVNTTDNAEKK